MTELSPAAQAIREAAFEPWQSTDTPESIAAAVLRAAVNHLCSEVSDGCHGLFAQGVSAFAETLEEIAKELESH